MDAVIFNKIIEVFNQTRGYILLLFPLAFFIRIAFGFIFLKNSSFTDILKDSLFLFLGLFFFTDILKLTLQIPYFVSQELSMGDWREINLGEGLFINMVKRIVDWLGILSYWISFGLYVVIVSIIGFFAGYILFFGTMFRAYGVLKVFFILLLTVSLWPLLWYSVNFAVYVVAVSDNALANNVIIGGASLAKLVVPIWIISKTSKIPIQQKLKTLSYIGSSLVYSGGNQAYSLIKNNSGDTNDNNSNIQESHLPEEIESQSLETASLSHREDEYDNGFEGDFSLNDAEINFEDKELNNQIKSSEDQISKIDQSTDNMTHKDSHLSIQESSSVENNTQNEINNTSQPENHHQMTQETKNQSITSESKNEHLSEERVDQKNSDSLETKENLLSSNIHKENWSETQEHTFNEVIEEKET